MISTLSLRSLTWAWGVYVLEILMLGLEGTLSTSNCDWRRLLEDGGWRLLMEMDWEWTGIRGGAGRVALGTSSDCFLGSGPGTLAS